LASGPGPDPYPNAIWDEQAAGWVSDAEVAEPSYTAFTSRKRQSGHGPADRLTLGTPWRSFIAAVA
jgi:hypothetical protein